MGQSLYSTRQSQSKEELLYQLVTTGNVDAIYALCREGAKLEWIGKDGKTPLIVACMDSGLFNVAKVLIEMGANVNTYRPGRGAGTPLHHAAKRGLDRTVSLLLSCRADALVRNDDCHTALDVARIKGHTNVVRAIENHTCYFSGWLWEYYGPGFLEALASRFLSSKIWAVVIPCGLLRLELVIYPSLQEAQPCTVIALWKAKIEEPKLHQSNSGLTIFDQSTKTQYKFASGNEGDKQQIYSLYNTCRGIHLVVPPPIHHDTQAEVPVNVNPTSAEAAELTMTLNTSIQSAGEDRPPLSNTPRNSDGVNANGQEVSVGGDSLNGWGPANGSTDTVASSSGWMDETAKEAYNGPVGSRSHGENHDRTPSLDQTIDTLISPAPSATPIPDQALDKGPIQYPSINSSPVDSSVLAMEHGSSVTSETKDGSGSSSCIICWEAPVEGACIPCGHMVGCMACLSDIKAKKGVCPVCRDKLNQVLRLCCLKIKPECNECPLGS